MIEPYPISLFQPIQIKVTYMKGNSRMNKTRWLFHIHLFLKYLIQENIMIIKLINQITVIYDNVRTNHIVTGLTVGLKVPK